MTAICILSWHNFFSGILQERMPAFSLALAEILLEYLRCWQDIIFFWSLYSLEAFLNPSFVNFNMRTVEKDSCSIYTAESETILLSSSISYTAFLNQL